MAIDFDKLSEELKSFDVEQLKKIGSLSLGIRMVVLAVIAVGTIIAGFILIVVPAQTVVNKKIAEEIRLKKEYQEYALKAPNLALYQKQIEAMEQTFNVLLTLLPAKVDMSEVLRDITEVSNETNVQIEVFDPSDSEVPKEFYATQPIKLKIKGSYHNLGNFVSEISKVPRIITLGDFKLVPAGGSSSDGQKVLKIEVTATAYRYVAN